MGWWRLNSFGPSGLAPLEAARRRRPWSRCPSPCRPAQENPALGLRSHRASPESARERARTTERGAAEERIDRDARAKSPTPRRPHTFVRFREQNPRCGAERRSRQRAPARGRFPTTTPAGVRLLPGSRVSGRTGALRHQEAEPSPEGPPLRRRSSSQRKRLLRTRARATSGGRWSASPTSTRVGGRAG